MLGDFIDVQPTKYFLWDNCKLKNLIAPNVKLDTK